jgi:hypothetical protein
MNKAHRDHDTKAFFEESRYHSGAPGNPEANPGSKANPRSSLVGYAPVKVKGVERSEKYNNLVGAVTNSDRFSKAPSLKSPRSPGSPRARQ